MRAQLGSSYARLLTISPHQNQMDDPGSAEEFATRMEEKISELAGTEYFEGLVEPLSPRA